jgi:hypothetical protein
MSELGFTGFLIFGLLNKFPIKELFLQHSITGFTGLASTRCDALRD